MMSFVRTKIIALCLAVCAVFVFSPTVVSNAEDGAADVELTVVNIRYGGKVIWLPSPIVARKGDTVRLTLVNNVKEDPAVHGFNIPGYKIRQSVARGVPSTVEFVAKKKGLFPIKCHLHPAHLHSQLLVLGK